MESVYSTLTNRALEFQKKSQIDHSQTRTLIAFAGPPGSGKSTIAAEVVRRLNKQSSQPFAIVLPMDGFHLSRAALDMLPNREEAFERRGVAWTFDAAGTIQLVEKLHATKQDRTVMISAPAFDHAEKDPVLDAIQIPGSVSLVVLEGLWLLYDEEPWRRISELVDDTWFVDVDPDIARYRVAKRHIVAGIETNWDDAAKRASGNDLVNGEEARRKMVRPGIVVRSVDANS